MEDRSTRDMIAAGKLFLSRGDNAKAYQIFQALYDRVEAEEEEVRAIIISCYGLARARHLRAWEEGKRICEEALGMQFYLPDTYVNLARLYLDRRLPPYQRKAEKLLQDALKVDPLHKDALTELERIRGNRFQAISFLSPDNVLNRVFAKLLGKG
jgi:hypothetical protein